MRKTDKLTDIQKIKLYSFKGAMDIQIFSALIISVVASFFALHNLLSLRNIPSLLIFSIIGFIFLSVAISKNKKTNESIKEFLSNLKGGYKKCLRKKQKQ